MYISFCEVRAVSNALWHGRGVPWMARKCAYLSIQAGWLQAPTLGGQSDEMLRGYGAVAADPGFEVIEARNRQQLAQERLSWTMATHFENCAVFTCRRSPVWAMETCEAIPRHCPPRRSALGCGARLSKRRRGWRGWHFEYGRENQVWIFEVMPVRVNNPPVTLVPSVVWSATPWARARYGSVTMVIFI